jgi:hypothetical protein
MNTMEESSDEGSVRRRRERCMEMAAMFKNQLKGNENDIKRIKAQFSLQEGVSIRKASEYFNLIRNAGLITVVSGHKNWQYKPKEEWELFKVEI